jgi:hypothetical protein
VVRRDRPVSYLLVIIGGGYGERGAAKKGGERAGEKRVAIGLGAGLLVVCDEGMSKQLFGRWPERERGWGREERERERERESIIRVIQCIMQYLSCVCML